MYQEHAAMVPYTNLASLCAVVYAGFNHGVYRLKSRIKFYLGTAENLFLLFGIITKTTIFL